MKNLIYVFGLVSILGVSLSTPSCMSKKLEQIEPELCDIVTVTYESHIKDIIDNSCAYAGCHDGAGGIGPGNYTNYGGLNSDINSGSFKERVIDQKDDSSLGMPPNQSAWPQSLKDDLTEDELELMQCWINANYPEN
ncbi:MAG: hypothetical protein P1U70_14665 [Saprospiraceae bacterium]|jgi:hypothetical protein|nr:hypothetical protein [Saprospiraceae bacterium]